MGPDLNAPGQSACGFPPLCHARSHGISYREMGEGDMAFLEALYGSTRADELAQTAWSDVQKREFIAMQFQAQHSHYRAHFPDALWLIIERADVPAGRLYLERWAHEHRIIDIALIPQLRGMGIGCAIMRDLLDEAAAAGKAVSIHVEKFNPAMRLYHRLGFVGVEDKGVYDLMRWRADTADQVKTDS